MRIAIFGATSAIAEATARQWAGEGARFFLVGRKEIVLGDIAADLKARGAVEVMTRVADLARLDGLGALCREAEEAFQGIDIALIAHGVLPNQVAVTTSVEALIDNLTVNAMSPAGLMVELGQIMRRQGHGSLVVLSSVAGDRGRPSNWAYGGAKAMLSVMGEGMALELDASGVNVIVVKPGFVDTPMTASFKKGLLWAKPEAIARSIVEAGKAGGNTRPIIYAPWFWRPIMLIIRLVPSPIFHKTKL